MIMKKVFACCILVLTLIACEKAGDQRLLNNEYYKTCEISSSDMDGLWYWWSCKVDIEDGKIDLAKDNPIGSLPEFGVLANYLVFNNGGIMSGYKHIKFYDYTINDEPSEAYCEYVMDVDRSSASIIFDKDSRSGMLSGLERLSGELTLLESSSTAVKLLLTDANKEDYYYLYFGCQDDPQVHERLMTWEFRNNYQQMWDDVDNYWKNK